MTVLGHFVVAAFNFFSIKNRLKGYSPGQLVFGHYMILPIKYTADWELLRQWKQAQINKDNILENSKRVDHDYKVGDKVMIANNAAFIYETLYNRPFEITKC